MPDMAITGRRRTVGGLVIVLILAYAMPAATWPIEAITSLPLRVIGLFAVQLAILALGLIGHFGINHGTGQELGYSRRHVGAQVGWMLIALAVLCALFIGLPMLFGLPVSGNKDALWFTVPNLLVAGFAEETLFRGYLLGTLQRLMGSKIAPIVVSSVLFGLFHWAHLNPLQLLVTAVIGAILAIMRTYAKNCTIASLAVAHGLYDIFLVILAWV
jgi:membrane protease YdiL (CAAX protease family)